MFENGSFTTSEASSASLLLNLHIYVCIVNSYIVHKISVRLVVTCAPDHAVCSCSSSTCLACTLKQCLREFMQVARSGARVPHREC